MKSRRISLAMRILTSATFLILWACFGASAPAAAQQSAVASLNGRITDAAGAVVAGAALMIKSGETGLETHVQANADGLYAIAPLPPGRYSLRVEQTGFKTRTIEGVILNVADRRLLNVTLEPGLENEVVTVAAETTVIQDSPTTQTLISGKQVIELPLNNRNFLKLTELIPGVSSGLDDESSFGITSRADISINGLRRNAVNYLVDGVSNVDVGSNITLLSTPTVDSIKEFKVLTSNYTAEFGRSAGGVVTIVTKGGEKDFHGSAYNFLRNDAFNANSFFNNRLGRNADGSRVAPTPKLRYNNFGATFSGPVVLPGYARDKTFFFFSFEGRRIARGVTDAAAIVPSVAQRMGDFSAALGNPLFRQGNGLSGTTRTGTPLMVVDTAGNMIQAREGMIFRADGQAYFNNVIPNGDISPLARALLPAFPMPNRTLRGMERNNFTFTPVNVNDTRQEVIRIDHVFNDRNRIFGRYTQDLSTTEESGGLFTNVNLPNIATTDTRAPGKVFAVSLTTIASARLVNEATFNYSSNAIKSNVIGRGRRSDYPGSEAIPEVFPENANNAIPTIAIVGLTPAGSLQGFNIEFQNFTYRDILTYTVGNHTLKFGGELTAERKNENANNITQGSFSFNGVATQGNSMTGIRLAQSGLPFADYLLGRASQYVEDERDVTVNFRFGRREFFAQDTWKVLPNLTLDYGLRYQYFVPVTDRNNVLTSFDPGRFNPARVPTCATRACAAFLRGTGDPLNGIIVAGVNSPFDRRVFSRDTNNFSPRVGVAWDPFKDGKTVVRAGYGFYYDQLLVGAFEQNAFVNPPFNNQFVFTGPGVTLASPNGGMLDPAPLRALVANAPDLKTPTAQQYSLGVQREVFRNAALDIAYVGTKGDNLLRQLNLNFPQPSRVVTNPANFNSFRPFQGYANINYRETSARSRYNGLLTSFNYNLESGLALTVAYTFSKTLTDATNDRDAIDEPQNPLDKRAEYAEARTSRPHVFSASYVYELPFFKTDPRPVARLLLGGWQVSGITTIASGQPIARVTSNAGNFIRGNRPNVVRDPNGGRAGTRDDRGLPFFFDPNAFTMPADGTFGNSGRAFARGPRQNQTNLAVTKNLRFLAEGGLRVELRAECFNVFNHTQFTGIGTNLNASETFGRPTGTRLPREFQFAARISF